jgi:hypothetical protein
VSSPDQPILVSEVRTQPINQALIILLDNELIPGESYDLFISFVAKIADPSNRTNGFYYSSYQDPNGETKQAN